MTAFLLPYAGLSEQIKAGQLRALASAGRGRTNMLPSVPTIAESGYPGHEVDFGLGPIVGHGLFVATRWEDWGGVT